MFERLPESIKHGGEIIESKKRRQGSSPQPITSRQNPLKNDDSMGPRRASTFPESVPDTKRTQLSHSLPISQSHFANLGLDPGYNSPTPSNPDFFDVVPGLTPASSTASLAGFSMAPSQTPQPRASFPPTPLPGSIVDPSGLSVPDISTIMFPSGDPMAYPNQPMTSFESRHPHMFDRNTASPAVGAGVPQQLSGMEMKPQGTVFGPAGHPMAGPRRLDNDVQLFSHGVPMYLLQNQQAQRGYQPHGSNPSVHLPGNNIQFDDLLSQEEWANTFLDPAMSLSNGRQPFNGHPQFTQQEQGMGGWR